MKHLLFAVFETNQYTRNVVNKLAENNINGTVLASTSLKHFMNELEDKFEIELDADEGIETISDVVDFVKKQLDEK